MPRRLGRKGKCRGSRDRDFVSSYVSQADVKISDFADNPATVLPSRCSKRAKNTKFCKVHLHDMTSASQPQIRSKLVMKEQEPGEGREDGGEAEEEKSRKDDEDLTWDEKNLSDFEDDFSYPHQTVDEEIDETLGTRGNKGSKKKAKKASRRKCLSVDEGTMYPADLWYILGRFILPEQVGTFAGLCKDALNVTRTVSFWRQLYHRHYNSSIQLPRNLQATSITRTLGLRAIVIRALYLMHEPYRRALTAPSPVGYGKYSPDAVTNHTCLYTWARGKHGGHFTYFLKMRDCEKEGAIHTECPYYDPNVHVNEHSRECMLKVHCGNFQDLPSAQIMGLRVVRASVSVSSNMRHHRLKLVFGRVDRRGQYVHSSLITVFLDPVLRVEVLHWWHPQFADSCQPSIDRAVLDNAVNSRDNMVWEGL